MGCAVFVGFADAHIGRTGLARTGDAAVTGGACVAVIAGCAGRLGGQRAGTRRRVARGRGAGGVAGGVAVNDRRGVEPAGRDPAGFVAEMHASADVGAVVSGAVGVVLAVADTYATGALPSGAERIGGARGPIVTSTTLMTRHRRAEPGVRLAGARAAKCVAGWIAGHDAARFDAAAPRGGGRVAKQHPVAQVTVFKGRAVRRELAFAELDDRAGAVGLATWELAAVGGGRALVIALTGRGIGAGGGVAGGARVGHAPVGGVDADVRGCRVSGCGPIERGVVHRGSTATGARRQERHEAARSTPAYERAGAGGG